jgi:hypothetical protein
MPPPLRHHWALGAEALVIALLAVAVIAVTHPLIWHLDTLVLGSGDMPDFIGQLWYARWMRTALTGGLDPNHAPTVMLPAGCVDLLVKRGPCMVYALTVPLQRPLGLLGAYNLAVLASLFFTAYAAFRLVLHLTGERRAALLCGLALIVHPALGSPMWDGHLDMMTLGFHFLFFLFLLRTLREPGWGAPVAAALSLWAAGLAYLGFAQILVVLAAPLVLAAGWRMVQARKLDRGVVARLALFSAVFLVLMAPILLLFTAQAPGTSLPAEEEATFPLLHLPRSVGDLGLATRIIVEGSLKSVWPLHGRALLFRLGSWITLSSLLLAVLGAWSQRATTRRWVWVALLALVVAFGPYLDWATTGPGGAGEHLVPLPGVLLYRYFPFLTRLRFPYRFMTGFLVAVTVLAGFGARRLLRSFAPRAAVQNGLVLAGIAILALEYGIATRHTLPAHFDRLPPVPEFYRVALPAEPGDFGIITVPLVLHKPNREEEAREYKPGAAAFQIYHQIFHGKRILGGRSLALAPPVAWERFLETNSLLVNIARWQEGEAAPTIPLLARDLEVLPRLGFRYLAVELPFLSPTARAALADYLPQVFGAPCVPDHDGVVAWDLRESGPARRGATGGRVALVPHGVAAAPEPAIPEAAPPEPASAQAALDLAARDIAAGLPWEAIERLERLPPGSPRQVEIHRLQAQAYAALGLPTLEAEQVRAALALQPNLEIDTTCLGLPAVVHPPEDQRRGGE